MVQADISAVHPPVCPACCTVKLTWNIVDLKFWQINKYCLAMWKCCFQTVKYIEWLCLFLTGVQVGCSIVLHALSVDAFPPRISGDSERFPAPCGRVFLRWLQH